MIYIWEQSTSMSGSTGGVTDLPIQPKGVTRRGTPLPPDQSKDIIDHRGGDLYKTERSNEE